MVSEQILMTSIPLRQLNTFIEVAVRKALSEVQENKQQTPAINPNKKLSIDQLIDYLPEHPAKQTVYGWVSNRKIPYQKHGSKLFFVQSDIDNWLDNGRVMSHLKDGY